jgi:hypothetical protein
MSAKQKLEEAKFFLEKLHGLQSLPQDFDKQTESKYYLAAFLSAAASVPDYLLEDYNAKFSLNISLSDKLYPDTFERAAKRTDNQPALLFLQWWKKEKKALEKDPIGELLIGKRHIDTHRVQIKPDLAKFVVSDSIHISGSLEAKLFRDGKLVETRKSAEQLAPSREETETTFNWFFSEYPDEPVLTVCEKFLDRVTSFVAEAERRFP